MNNTMVCCLHVQQMLTTMQGWDNACCTAQRVWLLVAMTMLAPTILGCYTSTGLRTCAHLENALELGRVCQAAAFCQGLYELELEHVTHTPPRS